MSTLEESVIDHRTNLRKFNPDLASAVGLLRERRQLFALSQEQWGNQKVVPKKLKGLDVITFNDMVPEKVYTGKVLHLTNIDLPMQFEYESSDARCMQHVSAVLLTMDSNNVSNRVFIYNYVLPTLIWEYEDFDEIQRRGDVDGKHLDKHLGLGFKLSVVSPQLKMASDGKLALIVTEPSNLIVQKIQNASKICQFCFKVDAESRCARCHKAHYCSKSCQEKDWSQRRHKLVCITEEQAAINGVKARKEHFANLRRPSWPVFELETLCYKDLCPSVSSGHEQLRRDFGFANCNRSEYEGQLIGLYQGLIKIMRVDMVKLHKASKENVLEALIRECFESYGSSYKGAYYEWFLQNPSIVRRIN